MARVPVVVSDDQKSDWQQYAEVNDEIDNVSDLIRTSVSKFIAEDQNESGWTEEEIDTIIEYLDTIDSTTTTTQTILEQFRDEAPEQANIEELVTYQKAQIQNTVKEAVEEAVAEAMEEDNE